MKPAPSPSAVPAYPGVPASSPPLPTPAASPVSYPPVPAPPEPYPSPPDHKGIKGAYWPSFDGFEASSIDTSYFTHIFYAFLLPDPVTFKLNVTPFDQQKIPGFIQNLRTRNPPVKTLLSMGGGVMLLHSYSQTYPVPKKHGKFSSIQPSKWLEHTDLMVWTWTGNILLMIRK
jgi:chitinase